MYIYITYQCTRCKIQLNDLQSYITALEMIKIHSNHSSILMFEPYCLTIYITAAWCWSLFTYTNYMQMYNNINNIMTTFSYIKGGNSSYQNNQQYNTFIIYSINDKIWAINKTVLTTRRNLTQPKLTGSEYRTGSVFSTEFQIIVYYFLSGLVQ